MSCDLIPNFLTPRPTWRFVRLAELHDLSTILDSFQHCRVAVIGDLMLDEYLWGHIERISPEAPVPILNIVSRTSTLGGAANVAENLLVLGVQVTVIGVVGMDETGQQICDLLGEHRADIQGVIRDPLRKSTRKTRLMSLEHGQQVFRLDEESAFAVDQNVEAKIVAAVEAMNDGIQVIVCSDYLKGVLSQKILATTFETASKRGIRSIVAPKDSNPQKYQGATILMPNARELMLLAGTSTNLEDSLDHSSRSLMERLSLEALVVTRGSQGMSLFEKSQHSFRRVDIPTTARSVYDVTGAGDTAIAAFGAAVASGADIETAARLATLTAGIKVGKRGTASVSIEEIRNSLKDAI
jgi:D-beta-D-heptose 7-phosphate kinase / D-beta-D-heptose 1-phosphate adenosyltransferase